jgi:hypothetical protein
MNENTQKNLGKLLLSAEKMNINTNLLMGCKEEQLVKKKSQFFRKVQ